MSTQWQGSVHVKAPVEVVYHYLADFARHTEWDDLTERIEQVAPGDGAGVGARYRAHERIDSLLSRGRAKDEGKRTHVGPSMREVRELVPNQRIAWHARPIPPIGVSADYRFELTPVGNGTQLTQVVQYNVPTVVDTVSRLILKGIDARQQAQCQANLERIKTACEA
jgi:uncharacterized membrane protein